MSLLIRPSELSNSVCLSGLIYGQPGVGKSTLALSAPNPVLIDADNGVHRVEKRFQVPSLPLKRYKDLLTLLEGNELDSFDTVVFDTVGKLVDRIGDYLMEVNPKNRQADGSLTLKAYGSLKAEFQRLIRSFQAKNKNLIFVAHEREEKDDDSKVVRPDISGSSGKDLVKDLDFMGYMEMRGNKRTISFSPCGKFYAKNSMRLPDIIELPETTKGNTFLQDVVIAGAIKRRNEDAEQNKKYEEFNLSMNELIKDIAGEGMANDTLGILEDSTPIWDSHFIAKRKLQDQVKSLGIIYNKESKQFEKTQKASA